MLRPPLVLAAAVALVAAAFAACSDGDDAGDEARFCELLTATQDPLGDEDISDPAAAQEALDQFAELEEAAPSDIRPAVATLREVLVQLVEADPDDPDSFAAVFSAVLDPDVQEAATELEEYARDVCGVELDDSGDDEASLDDDPTATPSDPFDEDDDEGLDTSAVFDLLETEYGDAAWRNAVVGVAIFNEREVSIETTLQPGDDATALDVCEAVSEYVFGPDNPDPDATSLEIVGGDGEPLATRTGAESCANS